jgi:hypothetical protein
MPAQRLLMRQVREVLRLKWACGLSDRKIAQSLRVSRPTVAEYVRRAQAVGLSWPLPATLDDIALEGRLFAMAAHTPMARRPTPDWRIVKIFELAFLLEVTLSTIAALHLVFRPPVTDTHRQDGR